MFFSFSLFPYETIPFLILDWILESLVLFNLLSVPIAACLLFFNPEISFLPRNTEKLCIYIHIFSIVISVVLLVSSLITFRIVDPLFSFSDFLSELFFFFGLVWLPALFGIYFWRLLAKRKSSDDMMASLR
jgi:hypothetical protein